MPPVISTAPRTRVALTTLERRLSLLHSRHPQFPTQVRLLRVGTLSFHSSKCSAGPPAQRTVCKLPQNCAAVWLLLAARVPWMGPANTAMKSAFAGFFFLIFTLTTVAAQQAPAPAPAPPAKDSIPSAAPLQRCFPSAFRERHGTSRTRSGSHSSRLFAGSLCGRALSATNAF